MIQVRKTNIPETALVNRYLGKPKARVDSYKIDVAGRVTLEEFVGSFYRGRLFRMERKIIEAVVGRKSSDAQIDALLAGETEIFSAWSLEARSLNQLIMCDYQSRTCSWFMVETLPSGTRLRFGSVIKPTGKSGQSERSSKLIVTLLLPLHGLYSRLLLSQAAKPFRR